MRPILRESSRGARAETGREHEALRDHRRGRLFKLEAIRGFAALYVVLHHAHLIAHGTLQVLFSFGQEAVMLFFLLSGFVIYYSTYGPGTPVTFGAYFNRRFRRIWPLFLFALLFAYGLTCLSHRALMPISTLQLLGNLLMLQDVSALKPGVWFDTFAGDSPLWSLSYEWWFYMLFFPLATLLAHRSGRQKYVAFAVSAVGALTYQAAPNQISLILGYFFIWWVGVEMGRQYLREQTLTWTGQAPALLMSTALTCLWSISAVGAKLHHAHLRFGTSPVLELRHMGSALALLVVGLAWYRAGFRGFRFTLSPLARLAPVSYGLYVLHVPVLLCLQSLLPWPPLARLVIALALVIPLAYLLEVVAQRRINRWFDRLIEPNVRPHIAARHESPALDLSAAD